MNHIATIRRLQQDISALQAEGHARGSRIGSLSTPNKPKPTKSKAPKKSTVAPNFGEAFTAKPGRLEPFRIMPQQE